MLSPGIDISHIASVRQRKDSVFPSLAETAFLAEAHGADPIVLQLNDDLLPDNAAEIAELRRTCRTRLVIQAAPTDDMLEALLRVRPDSVYVTHRYSAGIDTGRSLDVLRNLKKLSRFLDHLAAAGIAPGVCTDADLTLIAAARDAGAHRVKLHTGRYARTPERETRRQFAGALEECAYAAGEAGLYVAAGSGLNMHNIATVAKIPAIDEIHVGRAVFGHALLAGLPATVAQLREIMFRARCFP